MVYQQNNELDRDAGRNDVIQEGIKTQTYALEKGGDHWCLLRDWNEASRKLTSNEISIPEIACSMPRKIPIEKQCQILIAAEERAKVEGFLPR